MTVSKLIEDYGIIGNTISAALVGPRRFDRLALPAALRLGEACFAALLGGPEHGRWLLAPEDPACRISRRYVSGTAVLETHFETAAGSLHAYRFHAAHRRRGESRRCAHCAWRTGRSSMVMELVLRFNYGQAVPWVRAATTASALSPGRTRSNCTPALR